MAGARSRKLDLSGFLSGNSRTASIIANTDQSGGIGGLLNGIAGGVRTYGANRREDKVRADAKAEREKDRAFSQSLALKADARAERDQSIQEDEYKRKVASEARSVEETTHLLSRAQVADKTGMPMDPKVLEGIQKHATVIQAAGGVNGIMAKAAALEEPDVEGLVAQTAQYESLAALLTQQMGREKNPARHAALGDAFMQLGSIVSANKYRLRLHEANTKNRAEVAETRAKAEAEAGVKREEDDRTRSDRIAAMMDAGFLKKPPVNAVAADAAWERFQSQNKAAGTAQGRESVAEGKRVAEDARLRATYKAATGQDAPLDVDVETLRKWEVQNATQTAVAEDRKASREIRAQQAAETERHNRATEQLRALGTNNPNKDRMTALQQAAKLHLANAKQYGDYDSAVGDTTKAKEEIAAAKKAMAEFDALMRESGGAGTAPSYPSWLQETDAARKAWDAATPEQKAEQTKKRGG